MERIQKLISQAGITSRRKAEELIEKGKVLVNGKIAKLGDKADPQQDKIIVEGHEIRSEKKIYLMLNKPKGFITTASDPFGRPNVLQLLHEQQRVYPVGRLDQDTTGLLLLTNDGSFANRIMHPRYEVIKSYIATLDKNIEDKHIAAINEGVIIDRKKIDAKARSLSSKKVQITIHTGLNKEVKRIFKSLGYWVRELHRVQIASLKLDVKEGKYRHLHQSEVKKLLDSARSDSSKNL